MNMSWPVWLFVAVFALFMEYAGWFATGGRTNGWGDISYQVFFAVLSAFAFFNIVRAFLHKPV